MRADIRMGPYTQTKMVKAAANEEHLVVVVTQQVTPTFLQLVHVATVQVQARSEAGPRGGIDRPLI